MTGERWQREGIGKARACGGSGMLNINNKRSKGSPFKLLNMQVTFLSILFVSIISVKLDCIVNSLFVLVRKLFSSTLNAAFVLLKYLFLSLHLERIRRERGKIDFQTNS